MVKCKASHGPRLSFIIHMKNTISRCDPYSHNLEKTFICSQDNSCISWQWRKKNFYQHISQFLNSSLLYTQYFSDKFNIIMLKLSFTSWILVLSQQNLNFIIQQATIIILHKPHSPIYINLILQMFIPIDVSNHP